MEAWREGSDVLKGHRVFPRNQGHKVHRASLVCLECHSICHSSGALCLRLGFGFLDQNTDLYIFTRQIQHLSPFFFFHLAPFYRGQNTKRVIFERAVESSICHQNLLPTPQKCAAQSYNLSAHTHTGSYISPPPVLLTYIYTHIPTSRDSRRVTSVCVESGLH